MIGWLGLVMVIVFASDALELNAPKGKRKAAPKSKAKRVSASEKAARALEHAQLEELRLAIAMAGPLWGGVQHKAEQRSVARVDSR